MPVIYESWIDRRDLQDNPNWLYIFGDNDRRAGFGGQADAMRGEPNAVGIRTKKAPSRSPGAFWSDDNYNDNVRKITEDLEIVVEFLKGGGFVVVPDSGLGTGMSEMMMRCPKTFDYLNEAIAELATISSE